MTRSRNCPPGAHTAIFVEGSDEQRLCKRLLGPAGATVFFVVLDGRDGTQMWDRLAAARKDPGWPYIRNIGVMLDAEDSSVEALALGARAMPELGRTWSGGAGHVEADEIGTLLVWVNPDSRATGASETLLLRTVAADTLRCVEALFDCAPNPGATEAQRDKARARVALAGHGRPDQLWDDVDVEHPSLQPLRECLAALVR